MCVCVYVCVYVWCVCVYMCVWYVCVWCGVCVFLSMCVCVIIIIIIDGTNYKTCIPKEITAFARSDAVLD